MVRFFERLKLIVRMEPRGADRRGRGPRRRDPPHVGRSSIKEIEQAPPGRAEELVGHAVERVKT
jgi:hypothetical protein